MALRCILPLAAVVAFVHSHDLAVGLPSQNKVFDEKKIKSPAIWRQAENVTITANDTDVISGVVITDLRPDKDGDAKIVEGGQGKKNVTIELQSPTALRGYEFQIEVYTIIDESYDGSVKEDKVGAGPYVFGQDEDKKTNDNKPVTQVPNFNINTPLSPSSVGSKDLKPQDKIDQTDREKRLTPEIKTEVTTKTFNDNSTPKSTPQNSATTETLKGLNNPTTINFNPIGSTPKFGLDTKDKQDPKTIPEKDEDKEGIDTPITIEKDLKVNEKERHVRDTSSQDKTPPPFPRPESKDQTPPPFPQKPKDINNRNPSFPPSSKDIFPPAENTDKQREVRDTSSEKTPPPFPKATSENKDSQTPPPFPQRKCVGEIPCRHWDGKEFPTPPPSRQVRDTTEKTPPPFPKATSENKDSQTPPPFPPRPVDSKDFPPPPPGRQVRDTTEKTPPPFPKATSENKDQTPPPFPPRPSDGKEFPPPQHGRHARDTSQDKHHQHKHDNPALTGFDTKEHNSHTHRDNKGPTPRPNTKEIQPPKPELKDPKSTEHKRQARDTKAQDKTQEKTQFGSNPTLIGDQKNHQQVPTIQVQNPQGKILPGNEPDQFKNLNPSNIDTTKYSTQSPRNIPGSKTAPLYPQFGNNPQSSTSTPVTDSKNSKAQAKVTPKTVDDLEDSEDSDDILPEGNVKAVPKPFGASTQKPVISLQ